jgi:hypothetical protein
MVTFMSLASGSLKVTLVLAGMSHFVCHLWMNEDFITATLLIALLLVLLVAVILLMP